MKSGFLKLIQFCQCAFLFALFLWSSVANAQVLKLDPKTYTITISGTTNIHNFVSNVTQVSSEIVLKTSKQVQSLTVIIPVKSIKSGDKIMDSKTYETFKVENYPTIVFKLVELKSFQIHAADVSVELLGTLTMAGVTNTISLKSNGHIVRPGVYSFNGKVPIKMTDYGMKPPTAMMGLMKVGDEVVINYSVTFEGNESLNLDR